MKKRVVAIMLSLTMCLSMAAEASAASEADFTAETAAADVSEVAVFDDTADEGSSDDAVVVEPDDTGADDVQIDMGSDEDTSTDDAKETNEQESEADAFSSEDEAVDIQIYGLDETIGSEDSSDQIAAEWLDGQEAAVKENRWIEENGKWKLEKPVAKPVVVQSEESAEAPAAENASDDEVLVASEENQDAEIAIESQDEASAETAESQDEASAETAESQDAAAAQATSPYFTSADGLVKVTTMNTDSANTELAEGYYTFDEDGYLVTGRSQVENDYYYFKTSDEVNVTKDLGTDAITPYNSELGQKITNAWKWNAADQVFNYYGSDGKQETIAPNKIYTIDGDSYFLLSGGKPYVGTRTIDKAIYSFSNAANSSDIPGKMVRNAWVGENTKKGVQWRYFGSDGRYQKKGIGAYKVLADSNAYYLLDANGYLIKGKMVKAANKYYYLSNKNGVVYREKLVKYGKYRYYFTSDGRRATWKKRWALCKGAGNRYYYFGKTAGRVQEKKGIQKVTVKGKFKGWFYFSKKGNMLLNTWVSGRYYKADGSMASGLTKIGSKYYFFQRSTQKAYRGKVYKSQWIKFNKKYYCASRNGSLYVNGWRRVSCGGHKYYFYFKNCAAQTNQKIKRGDVYGTLDGRGRFIESGWVVVNSSRNLVRYMDPKTGKYVKNTIKEINGIQYRFDKKGYRVNDRTNEVKRSKYYLSCDRVNGVMTVYADKSRTIPIKTIRVSVGNPTTLTPAGTFTVKRSLRWQPVMGPSWGQYGSHVVGGIYVHSVACGEKNDHNLPVGEYLRLGNPASHGCIRCCVADAKWVFDNCNGSEIKIYDGIYKSDEALKGPLGRKALTPLRGAKNFDPTDPAYN